MLVELLISMTFLVVAIGALLSVYTSSMLTVRHASVEGNALTLADRQLELYNTLPNTLIQLDASTIPSGSDPVRHCPLVRFDDPALHRPGDRRLRSVVLFGRDAAAELRHADRHRSRRPLIPRRHLRREHTAERGLHGESGQGRDRRRSVDDGNTVESIKARAFSAYDPCNPPPPNSTSTSC